MTLPTMPSIYNVEVFSKCNLACPMCPTGQAQGHISYSTSAVNLGLIDSLISQDAFCSTSFLELHFRGEPTLHKYLGEIVDKLNPEVTYLGLSTHGGTLRNTKVRESLLKLQYVTLSIDGVGEEYEKIRIGNKFDTVVEGVELLFKEKDARGNKFPLIDIQTVEVPNTDYELQKQLVQELIENRGWDAQFRDMPDTLTWQGELKDLGNSEVCSNPWNSVSIKANGDVVACCLSFDDNPDLTYGNLYEESLIAIWNGDKANALRRSMQEGKENKFCKACNFKSPHKFHDELITSALHHEAQK